MIRSGTLLIQKGVELPKSIALKGDPATDEWTAVESGTDLRQLKAALAGAGWNCFYMGAVKQTVLGRGPKRFASALIGIGAKMRLNHCNSLQIDAITPHSLLGIPYMSVSAHCCHIQEGVIFTGSTP
jgi:hypothetical protein